MASKHSYYSTVKDVKLTVGVAIHSFMIFFGLYLLAVLGLIYLFYPIEAHRINLYFSLAWDQCIVHDNYTIGYTNLHNGLLFLWLIYFKVFLINLYLWLLYPLILYVIKKLKTDSNFLRGAQLIDVSKMIELIAGKKTRLPLGEMELPIENEVRGTFIGGRPGVGKTNLFNGWMKSIITDDEKAVIYDSKRDYIANYYNEKSDILLNPFDDRCTKWTVLNDAQTIMDLMALAKSIIPLAPPNSDSVWYDAPRNILYSIFVYCFKNDKKRNKDIWEILNYPKDQLKKIFQYTKGCELGYSAMNTHKDTLSSIMLKLAQYSNIFEFLQHIDGEFSIRRWVQSPVRNRMFLPNYFDTKVAMQPFFSLIVETLIKDVLSLADDRNRRIFFILDEFGTIQKMDMLVDLLTQGRSKGAATFLGTQDVVRIDTIYGKELREALINACGNCITFAMEDVTDANIFSEKLGTIEVEENQESFILGEKNDKVNVSKQKKIHKLVLPSEIQGLKDFTAYAKIANCGITYIKSKYIPTEKISEDFVLNKVYLLENETKPQADNYDERLPDLSQFDEVKENSSDQEESIDKVSTF